MKINLFKPRKEKMKNYEPSAPPYYESFFNIKWNQLIAWEDVIIVKLIIKLNMKRETPRLKNLLKL